MAPKGPNIPTFLRYIQISSVSNKCLFKAVAPKKKKKNKKQTEETFMHKQCHCVVINQSIVKISITTSLQHTRQTSTRNAKHLQTAADEQTWVRD